MNIFYKGQKKRLIKTIVYTVRNCMITVETIISCIVLIGELSNYGVNVKLLLENRIPIDFKNIIEGDLK